MKIVMMLLFLIPTLCFAEQTILTISNKGKQDETTFYKEDSQQWTFEYIFKGKRMLKDNSARSIKSGENVKVPGGVVCNISPEFRFTRDKERKTMALKSANCTLDGKTVVKLMSQCGNHTPEMHQVFKDENVTFFIGCK